MSKENDPKQEGEEKSENPEGSEGNPSEEQNQSLDWLEDVDLPEGVDKSNPAEVAKHFKGIADRRTTQLNNVKESVTKEDKPTDEGDNELDYAKLSYLNSKGIPEDDHEFVLGLEDKTGEPLNEVLGKKWVQNELQERREQRAADDATPSGKNRSGESVRSNVDYWIEKGELPPKSEQPELRRKVVREKRKRAEKKGSQKFTDTPVVK